MAGRGVTMVGHYRGEEIISLRVSQNVETFTGWVGNKTVDKNRDGSISPLWEILKQETMSCKDVLKTLTKNGKSKLVPIDTFESNGNSVNVKALYPFEGQTYCLFYANKGRWQLMVSGSKTVEELKMAGYDSRGGSNTPLIFGVNKEKDIVTILNPI